MNKRLAAGAPRPGPSDFAPERFRKGPRRKVLLLPVIGDIKFGEYMKASIALDIPYLAAAARAAGHAVDVLPLIGREAIATLLPRKLAEFSPDIVGMSCYLLNFDACMEAARVVKSVAPGCHVVLGGSQASASSEICLSHACIDTVAFGEGEVTFCALIGALGSKRAIARVRGLALRTASGRVVRTQTRPRIRDLDTLPLPALDLFPREFWYAKFDGRVTGSFLGSRGCTSACTFCASPVIWGRRYGTHSPRRIVYEMNLLNERYGVEHFSSYDNNFTIRRAHVLEFCELLVKERRSDFEWLCHTRADLVDPDLLRQMRKAGCTMIYYGFDSGSQRLLDRVTKGMTLEQYRYAVKITREADIRIAAAFMIGFPTETPEETAQTLRFAKEIRPFIASVNIAIPFMGTAMYDDALKHGSLVPGATRDDLARSDGIWVPHGRTREELARWRKRGFSLGEINCGHTLTDGGIGDPAPSKPKDQAGRK